MSSTPASSGTNTRVQNFAEMSAILTGFLLEAIAPFYDPTDLKTLYLNTADKESGASTVDALIAQYLTLKGKPKQQIADTLLDVNNAKPAAPAQLARMLVALWYLGVWYGANPAVVSPNAYIGGLAWKVAQTHPMGYSEFMFGYWNQPPAPLSSFGVDTGEGDSNG